jgi:hypothetical protein
MNQESGPFMVKALGFMSLPLLTPALTVIGSSNYSYRSNRRDTEA